MPEQSVTVLDLATKVVSPNQHIWAMFPGLGRRFLSQYQDQGLIFLDMPGISLSPTVLADDRLLRKHIAMSIAWADYYRFGGDKVPSRRPDDFSPGRGRSFNSAVGNVKNVFVRMRPGDLVLVGRQSLYDPILIGEIEGEFDPKETVRVERYGNERIPARHVRWLAVNVERRYLSQTLSLLLSNRHAVISIDKDKYGEEVYKVAYGEYVFGTDSRYVFQGPKYKNIAPATVPGINLITYFVAAFNACELDEVEEFAKLDIQGAIDNYFEQDILHSFEIEFSSPGEYVLHAKRAALPLFVAVAIAATDGYISGVQEARSVEIMNSATTAQVAVPPPADACIEIQEKYRAIMNAINADRFNDLCALNKDAQSGVGLKVNVKKRKKK